MENQHERCAFGNICRTHYRQPRHRLHDKLQKFVNAAIAFAGEASQYGFSLPVAMRALSGRAAASVASQSPQETVNWAKAAGSAAASSVKDGTWKQYRGSGQDHGNIARPNVKETGINNAPDGSQFIGKPKVREPRSDEFPGGR
ncbi:hypothetical protein CFB35_18915 [Burkholderia sp. AU16482]|nr:hypothetical protein CFB35_18915 [Burkholderia sp. AU16482]